MILIKCILLVWLICSIGAFFQFVSDVHKWHDPEKDILITPSKDIVNESEVKEDARDSEFVHDAGERDSSAVSFPWSES